jgi:hypothetical protein
MKLRILTLVGAVALGAAGGAIASNGGGGASKAIQLTPGTAIGYAGLTCTAYAGTSPTNANIVCVRDNLQGFGVVVSQQQVIVAKANKGKIKVFFRHSNT